MSKQIIEKRVIHNDDWQLTLQHPDDISDYTGMSNDEVKYKFLALARILFDNILTKDRKRFVIEQDEKTGEWIYLFEK